MRKLRASEVKNTKLEMQLNGLKVEYDAAKEDLGRAAGVSLIARQVWPRPSDLHAVSNGLCGRC